MNLAKIVLLSIVFLGIQSQASTTFLKAGKTVLALQNQNGKASLKPLDSTDPTQPPQIQPIRYATARVHIIKNNFNPDPTQPSIQKQEICIVSAPQVPVYDVRNSPSDQISSMGIVNCTDPSNNSTIYVGVSVLLTRAVLIDTMEDLKGAFAMFFVQPAGNGPTTVTPDASSITFVKNMNESNFINFVQPPESNTSTTTAGFYSVIVDTQD